MPTYSQAKKVIWDSTTNDGMRILDYFPEQMIAQKNQQEMKIRLTNGSLFQLIGSDNIDSLMGTNPKIVIFSEYALQTPDAWDFIRPILKINGGTAIFISTPRGRNHFYDLYQMATVQHDWWAQTLTYKDTGILTEEDIKKEIAEGMSEELAEQEYGCSFDRGVDGAFYAKLVTKMRNEDRILPLNYDPYKLVHLAVDLGWDDSTAIIFFQIDGDTIKIIDCEEHSNKTLHWYKNLLMEKGYKYGTYLFPHDVEHVDGLSTGLTRKEILEDMQIPVTVVPRSFIVDGIEAVKVLLSSRILINSNKCMPLIKSIENYHREYDEHKKIYKEKPCHDWSSHHCFIGETQVLTTHGNKNIDKIVVGDNVVTPFGIRKVLNIHARNSNHLIDVKHNDTVLFTCTPDHDIFTQKGLIKSDALRYNTLEPYSKFRSVYWKIFGCFCAAQDLKGFKRIILSQRMKERSSLMDFFIDGMESITEEPLQRVISQAHCIVPFGFTIKGIFQKAWKFITKTTTKITTLLTTSNYYLEGNTRDITQTALVVGHNQMNAQMFLGNTQKKQKNGIDQKMEENGIENIQKTAFLRLWGKDIISNVIYANRNLLVSRDGKDFALMDAKQNIDLDLVSTLKIGFALFAMKVLRSISTPSKQHVVTSVESRKCDTQNMVYDLTIETDNCYYANGYLVSNCDAMRYLAEGLRFVQSSKRGGDDDIKAINAYWGR